MHFGKKIFKNINRSFRVLYKSLEIPFSTRYTKKHVFLYPELKKMNKIMRKFCKKPKLQITVSDNLIPCRFTTEDGVIIDALQYITDPKSDKWMIASHWFAGNKYWALYFAKPFIELGYNILVYDFRNHGKSQKDLESTMGYNEAKDLLGAMKWLKENKQYKVLGLMGISMGAFVTNYVVAKHWDLLPVYNVKFVISDVTYGSIQTLLMHIKNNWLRYLLSKKKIAKKVEKILKTQSKETGINWCDLDIFKYYEELDVPAKVPTFFSHGQNDKITPPTDTYRLFIDRSQKNTNDEIMIYNYSTHAFALKKHYNKQIYHWLKFENKIIQDDEATKKAMIAFSITEELMHNNLEEKYEVKSMYFNNSNSKKKNNKTLEEIC